MAKINTLFKKGYLLAGVIMAANMFVVNEVKASQNQNNEKPQGEPQNVEGKDNEGEIIPVKKGFRGRLLYWENRINFFGGALFTLANSYYKFYENKPGFYFDYYFAGWNSNPFVNGYLQFCPNINLGRGGFWLIATFWGSYEYLIGKKSIIELKSTAGLMANKIVTVFKKASFKVFYLIFSILQGFVSMPLTVHIAKFDFSISISLDSMILGIVGMILEPKDKNDEKKDNKEEELKEIKEK